MEIYGSSKLRMIRCWLNKTPGHVVLPPSTIMRVQSLKLQCKTRKKHHGGVGRVQLPGNGMNINSNIPVVTAAFHDSAEGLKRCITLKWIKMGMANVRSIKNMELLIYNLIKQNVLDLLFITETWLKFPNCLCSISARQLELLLWRAGLTAQHMQDFPILFIQLNYARKTLRGRCWDVRPALQCSSSNCLLLILQRQLGNYLLNTGKNYSPTAQHRQD